VTRLFNDPATFADEALAGFCDIHAELVRRVPGGVVRRSTTGPKVAVLVGGGSGHYPAFCGLVGQGFADGAVVGDIFTSPSAQRAYSVARAAESGRGLVFAYGNYAGDVMNFGLAGERLGADGIRAEQVIVTDDIASAPPQEIGRRRGIAGDFVVFKALGAAAERGDELDEVARLGRLANDRTRTIGTAFAGCSFPGASEPLFTVPTGKMGLGLGIHGEPGVSDEPMPGAADLGRDLVRRVLADAPGSAGDEVAVILNGLGSTKHEELFVLWTTVAEQLRAAGLTVVEPEVGELVTSLDMGGVSLTVTWLDAELRELWSAPAYTPAYRKGSVVHAVMGEAAVGVPDPVVPGPVIGSDVSQRAGRVVLDALTLAADAVREAADDLGRIDAVAGDGDHGRGMVRGLTAAVAAAREAVATRAGASGVLAAAGDSWADEAGGTSGVLWGAALRSAGVSLGDTVAPDNRSVVAAARAFSDRIVELGGARVGDKTLVDALLPFVETLESAQDAELPVAWERAANAATKAAQATADLVPKKGRARPLAERSVGTPDPGAVSLALIAITIANLFSTEESYA